jgi:hypothetical protein
MTDKVRGPVSRYYIDETGDVIRRLGGEDERQGFADVSDAVWTRLAQEGYIHFRILGRSHDEIMAGSAFFDRAPPSRGKEPGIWIKAIANVKALNVLRAAKVAGGDKPDKAQIAAINETALAWAKGLTADQVKELRADRNVMIAHAELSGSAASHDLLLAPLAKQDMQEAAD